jgi:NAD(P)-dependent dehydrogenase (short-subunit alcohol dehydrogenase family)
MNRELEGQVAIVTGGAAGIGAAIAAGLAAAGASVASFDLSGAWKCDVTRSDEVKAMCSRVAREIGAVSILVNNAGGSGSVPIEHVEDMTDEAWDAILSLNVGSVMRLCREVVPGMKQRRYGRIVNISSTLKDGMFGPLGPLGARLAYVTAKSAIVGMTRQLAKDLGSFGITANAIAPGLTLAGESARITQRFHALPPEARQRMTSHVPAGRLGSGEDMANAALFLVSPVSGYVNGEVLSVAGGA